MKNKIFSFFFLGGFIFFVVFQIKNLFQCWAFYEKDLIISEIMFDPEGPNSSSSEWIEFYNAGENEIILQKENFKFSDEESPKFSSNNQRFLGCHSIPENIVVPAKSFFVLAENKSNFEKQKEYEEINPQIIFDSSFDLSSSHGFLKLSNDNCASFFVEMEYESSWGGKNNGKTLEKKELENSAYLENNWQESFCVGGTPGEKNSQKNDCSNEDNPEESFVENSSYAGKVSINEIYPAPPAKNSEKWKNLDDECLKNEFVEIENKEKNSIDFSHWTIRDEKGNSSKIISQITAKNFIVFCGSFSLNNDSKGDTVFLYDEENKLIDKKSYHSGKEQLSYSFDGDIWRWTSQPTPGKENLFDKKLSAKIEKEKDLYQNIYTYFNLKAPAEAKKFVWDFGDGHKSYLKNTRHKYENTGKFNVSVKISGKGETSWQEFSVTVKKYRAPKIKIVKLSPNPKDKDSKYEWIEIENKSRKKVNLKNWSIATGWEKLYNHPIKKDFIIQPGKTKKLTRSVCAFTLANNKTKIELRDPSGKIIQKISYNKKNEIVREEENYQKTKDGWKWTNLESSNVLAKINSPKNYPLPIAFPETKKENLPKFSGYSINPAWQEKKIKMEKIVFINSKIKVPQNKIALLEKEREAKIKISYDYYFFTKTSPQKHWLIVLKENYWKKTNLFLNKFFLKINF